MILRYARTLRHLRAQQVWGQLLVRWRRCLRDPARIVRGEGPPWRLRDDRGSGTPDPPSAPHDPAGLAAGRFCFIGIHRDLGARPDWAAPGLPLLWRYNLHYFDWLWSLLPENEPDWPGARRLVLDWIARHPPARGACGWEPYPTSLRLINWCLLFAVRHRERTLGDLALLEALRGSLQAQARWLARNLETHIGANHLMENLAALACVQALFDWPDGARLKQRILAMLGRELAEQVLPDGLHYERSPMYHQRVLWLAGVLAAVGDGAVRAMVAPIIGPMRRALALLTHPDGGIALFNDAALGVYAMPRGLPSALPGPWALPDAGYCGWRGLGGDYLALDAAPIGPDHQPGHAHADFLTFELSLAGGRVVTDTGVGGYEPGAGRSWDRSTAAHNTVEVEGGNSCEVWGSFRVGRRVRPTILEWAPDADGIVLEASHGGYRHLPQCVTHARRFQMGTGRLQIRDRVDGRGRFTAVARLHLAPGLKAATDGDGLMVVGAAKPFTIRTSGQGRLVLATTPYSPNFGTRIDRTAIEWHVEVNGASEWTTTLAW